MKCLTFDDPVIRHPSFSGTCFACVDFHYNRNVAHYSSAFARVYLSQRQHQQSRKKREAKTSRDPDFLFKRRAMIPTR